MSLPKGFTQTIQPGTKVLIATFPADGHFNPLTGIAMHLKSVGCDVRWYSSKYYTEKLNRLQIPYFLMQRAMDFDSNRIDESFPQRAAHRSQISKLVFDLVHAFILRGPEYFEDIKAIKNEFDFDIMVADIAFTAIPFVKEKLNVPVVSVGILPLPLTSRDLPPAGLGMTPAAGFFGKRKQDLLRFIADNLLFKKPNRIMREVLAGYDVDSEGLNIFDLNIHKADIFLQSGTPGFEYKRSDLLSTLRFIGPLLPYHKKKGDKLWYDEKLRRFDKVILVTQGTIEKDVEKLIVPVLELYKDSAYLVVATTGGSQTRELRERYPQYNIIIEDFIPFDEIMPYADVYVSNGGYGGVLLSIQHEIPMVVAGVHEGKNEINARVGYFELGINLRTEKPSAAQIRKSVGAILASEKYNRNIRRLKEEFDEYDAVAICAQHVAEIVSRRKLAKRKMNVLHLNN